MKTVSKPDMLTHALIKKGSKHECPEITLEQRIAQVEAPPAVYFISITSCAGYVADQGLTHLVTSSFLVPEGKNQSNLYKAQDASPAVLTQLYWFVHLGGQS